MKICSVEGCGRKHYAHDFCNLHWRRVREGKALDRPIVTRGHVRKYFDEVVVLYDKPDCLIWPYHRHSTTGLGYIANGKRPKIVSRLVCEVANGPPPTPKHEAAHSCGKGHLGCVNPKHLSWKTPKENAADKLTHGTHRTGETVYNSKYKSDDIRMIRKLGKYITHEEIGAMFGISRRYISSIISGDKWAHL